MAKEPTPPSANLQSYLNAPKIRVDTWNTLATLANQLHYQNSTETEKRKLLEQLDLNLKTLLPIEHFNAFPGEKIINKLVAFFNHQDFERFFKLTSCIVLALRSNICNYKGILKILQEEEIDEKKFIDAIEHPDRHYFEVLVVDDVSQAKKKLISEEIESYFNANDKFVYELLFVNSISDAVIACMFNFNIKACLFSDFLKSSEELQSTSLFSSILSQAKAIHRFKQKTQMDPSSLAFELAQTIRSLRQNEIDLYYLASHDPEKNISTSSEIFNRIFYDFENYFELHLTILKGIKSHYETPFFDSLKQYTLQPKSTFHALPVARGKSILKSRWIQDMHEFYGKNIFFAESSATAGGLDSLMNPIGSIKQAMNKAAEYFGAHESFFVTNGTSASNKIMHSTLLEPGDIVLLEHGCHESHHYGLILIGAFPIFLNGYSMNNVDLTGAVPLKVIKEELLKLKKANKLNKVKLVVLTNCTFDGLVYNSQKYMEELLGIKPDLMFLWDEAWFSYARSIPHYRLRTAMHAAHQLETKYASQEYREEYKNYLKTLQAADDEDAFLLENHPLPDPDSVRIRVFCTQSIHKTLSCLRQGSMIHIYDSSFDQLREQFTHAFITHSTTSPNYQIIATMDLARRQADLEGFELVQNAIELSMIFRQQLNQHPMISKFFQALGPSELIPEEFRQSNIRSGYAPKDWDTVVQAWKRDDIVIDPTRVTLLIKHKLTGFELKRQLMDRFGIQVNKVSLNSILLQFNIGTLRTSVALLLEALLMIAKKLQPFAQTPAPTVYPLHFNTFSEEFLPYPGLPAGDLRKAYFASRHDKDTEILPMEKILEQVQAGEKIVSASIVIPVPPGYPALLPGQVISEDILFYLMRTDSGSVLAGYPISQGIKVFSRRLS